MASMAGTQTAQTIFTTFSKRFVCWSPTAKSSAWCFLVLRCKAQEILQLTRELSSVKEEELGASMETGSELRH